MKGGYSPMTAPIVTNPILDTLAGMESRRPSLVRTCLAQFLLEFGAVTFCGSIPH
jgi:hypothetical protein